MLGVGQSHYFRTSHTRYSTDHLGKKKKQTNVQLKSIVQLQVQHSSHINYQSHIQTKRPKLSNCFNCCNYILKQHWESKFHCSSYEYNPPIWTVLKCKKN